MKNTYTLKSHLCRFSKFYKKDSAEAAPLTADVALVDPDATELAELAADKIDISPTAALPAPVDNYEERLRMAREAVRADSKRVAQVVKGWVSND